MKRLLLVFTCFLFLVSSVSAYELEFYHSDHLGSPVVVTGENQDVLWSSDYDVFGEAVNEQGDGDLKYNQKEKDDTGLLYYGARYYNAELGRFITADTVKGEMIDLQSQNLYVYVRNNPMKYIDPTGNQAEEAGFIGPPAPVKTLHADPARLAEITKEIAQGHWAAIENTGTGTHYGSESSGAYRGNYQGSNLKQTSCIGYPLEVLDTYFNEVGGDSLDLWKETRTKALAISNNHPTNIESNTKGLLGIGLAKALQEVGWDVYGYGQSSKDWTYFMAEKNNIYATSNNPHNTIQNVVGGINVNDLDSISELGGYAIGATKGGFHMWNVAGNQAQIYEVHYDKEANNRMLFEGPFYDVPSDYHRLNNFAESNGFLVTPPKTQ